MTLSGEGDWRSLLEDSSRGPVLLFKHSPRCGTSAYIKERLETHPLLSGMTCHLLDVVQYRPLARSIAEALEERHESPQILLIHHRECVWAEDHMAISAEEIRVEYDHRIAQ